MRGKDLPSAKALKGGPLFLGRHLLGGNSLIHDSDIADISNDSKDKRLFRGEDIWVGDGGGRMKLAIQANIWVIYILVPLSTAYTAKCGLKKDSEFWASFQGLLLELMNCI